MGPLMDNKTRKKKNQKKKKKGGKEKGIDTENAHVTVNKVLITSYMQHVRKRPSGNTLLTSLVLSISFAIYAEFVIIVDFCTIILILDKSNNT
jgi:hypothetical protein